MTDPRTRTRMQDDPRPSNHGQILHRIAEALDRPVSDFFQHEAGGSGSEVPSAAECELLLTAFLRVKDTEARSRIIDMMRTYSGN